MAFTKIAAAGIGSTELVTLHSLEVLNNATVGGVLTYEDVTNVDSIGIVTARAGVLVGSGITLSKDGDIFATGVTTTGSLVSNGNIDVASHIRHIGDTDTKISFDTNIIHLDTANVERVRVTAAGHVVTQGLTGASYNNDGNNTKVLELTGDGTVGEYGVLNLSGNQNADDSAVGAIKFINRENSNDSSGTDASSKSLATIDVFTDTGDSNAGDDCGGYMRFITKADGGGNTEKLRIDSAGRILIGGTSAIIGSSSEFNEIVLTGKTRGAGITLQDVDANTRFQIRTDDAGGDPQTLLNASTNHPIVIRTNNTERLRIYSNGAVLIGADSGEAGGNAKLAIDCQGMDINDGVGDASNYGLIFANDSATNKANGIGFFNDSASTCGGYIVHQDKGSGNIGDLVFGTSADSDTPLERVRITSGGKFNIGDPTNTGYALKVKTTGSATALASFENTGGGVDGVEVSIFHNSPTPADGDQTGYLQFTGNDSAGNNTIFNAIIGYSTDVTDGTEDGDLRFFCRDDATFSQKLNIASDGTFYGSSSNDISDQRLKDNIATVVDPITKIKALKGRTFTWKPEAKLPAGTKYGFIAQEVETVVSDLVDDKRGIRQFDKDGNLIPEDENGKINTDEGTTDSKSVNAIGVVPILVEALKEALVKIETLETKVAALEG